MNNKCFEARVLTLFPEMFPGPLAYSLAGKAIEKKIWKLNTINIRDYAKDKYGSVDDEPYGGGPGMIMRPDILGKAFDNNNPGNEWKKIVLTPRGKPLTQKKVKEISSKPGVVIVCGRYEGIDERFISSRSLDEICIGDYILSGGESASFVIIDTILRLLPNVLGNNMSKNDESFENALLEYPQYTKPQICEKKKVPEVLLSGDHAKIKDWRLSQSEVITRDRRPDLWQKYIKNKK